MKTFCEFCFCIIHECVEITFSQLQFFNGNLLYFRVLKVSIICVANQRLRIYVFKWNFPSPLMCLPLKINKSCLITLKSQTMWC